MRIPDERDVVPFVQESVFLHHPASVRAVVRSAIGLYGLDGNEPGSHLPGISELVLEPAGRRAIGRTRSRSWSSCWNGSAWCSAASAARARG